MKKDQNGSSKSKGHNNPVLTRQMVMRELKNDIALHGERVARLCANYGVPMPRITIIARDPDKTEMYAVVTNEDEEGLTKACGLALQPPADTVI